MLACLATTATAACSGTALQVGAADGGPADGGDFDAGLADGGRADAGMDAASAGDGGLDAARDGTPPEASMEAGTHDGAAVGDAAADGGADVRLDAGPRKRVFVTSTQHDGSFGGLAGADAICAARAAEAGLGGTYRAWLSTTGVSAASRLTHAPVPYVRTDGARVADDWADLTGGTIDVPIDRDEAGVRRFGDVWTATLMDGSSYTSGDCTGWTVADIEQRSLCGASDSRDSAWTTNIVVACTASLRLYCLEQ